MTNSQNQFSPLEAVINGGNAILILGAGFSAGLKNRLGQSMPLSVELATKIAQYLKIEGNASPNLQEAYDYLRQQPISSINDFLEGQLLVDEIPDEKDYYHNLLHFNWRRIYTLNFDNVLDLLVNKTSKGFNASIYGKHNVVSDSDRIVYLHGKLPITSNIDDLIVTRKKYSALERNVQMLKLAEEFVQYPVIIVGSKMWEGDFDDSLALFIDGVVKSKRTQPGFFLNHKIDVVESNNWKRNHNIDTIETNAAEFLQWLGSLKPDAKLISAKEEVHDFVREKYLDISKFVDEEFSDDSILKYSHLFKLIANDNSTLHKTDNLFSHFTKIIFADDGVEEPLLIKGLPNSGKSTFLIILYHYIKTHVKNWIPIYIDFKPYHAFENDTDAMQSLKDHVRKLNEIILKSNLKEKTLLLLDGIDDNYIYTINRTREFESFVKANLLYKKRIVGLGISLTGKDADADSQLDEICLANISVHNPQHKDFIKSYSEIATLRKRKTIPSFNANDLEKYLLKRIKDFNLQRIDFFMLSMLTEYQGRKSDHAKNVFEFYKSYCLSAASIDNNTLLKALASVYDLYIKKAEISLNRNIQQLIWKHYSFRDFLIAYFTVEQLKSATPSIFTNFKVYTSEINNFCKEIINSDVGLQQLILDKIKFNYDKADLGAKTHFCYLLGRFSDRYCKKEALAFLNVIYNKERIFNKRNERDKRQLLYYRTVYISAIYLGDSNKNSEYLNLLTTYEHWNNINRGFHREYYGDRPFEPGLDTLTYEDDENESYDNTFTRLYQKIKDAIRSGHGYTLYDIELYTLCSLVQHRNVLGNPHYSNEKKQQLSEIIAKGKRLIRCAHLREFVDFMTEELEIKKHSIKGYHLVRLLNIKSEKRMGWVRRSEEPGEIPVIYPESVASHIYGAYVIAKFCLPDELSSEIEGYKAYNKFKILEMLLIHDIAEAITGDIPYGEKGEEEIALERKVIRNIAFLSSYFPGSSVRRIKTLFEKIEDHNSNDINVRIAKDIDKLDNFVQLYIYHFDKKELRTETFLDWKDKLYERLQTEIGREIASYIIDYYQA